MITHPSKVGREGQTIVQLSSCTFSANMALGSTGLSCHVSIGSNLVEPAHFINVRRATSLVMAVGQRGNDALLSTSGFNQYDNDDDGSAPLPKHPPQQEPDPSPNTHLLHLPAELRIRIWNEVLKGQRSAASQIVNHEPTRSRRYHVLSAYHKYLCVNRQVSIEIKACLSKNPSATTIYSKFNVTNHKRSPLAASRMLFPIQVAGGSIQTAGQDVLVHIGVFQRIDGRLRLLGEVFWAGRLDRKEKIISLARKSRLRLERQSTKLVNGRCPETPRGKQILSVNA